MEIKHGAQYGDKFYFWVYFKWCNHDVILRLNTGLFILPDKVCIIEIWRSKIDVKRHKNSIFQIVV